ncbi:MAG: lysophospholipid acyltransferase family protein [Thermodesulfobacteriota bacterium]
MLHSWAVQGLIGVLRAVVPLWCGTLRYSRRNYEPLAAMRTAGQPVVFAIWHDELFPLCTLHRGEGVVAVVSQSRDGDILASVLRSLGYRLARGSTHRGGLRALVGACREMQQSRRDAVLTVDGPKGPRHEAKPGAVYLAARTGALLVPTRVTMSRVKRFEKAWDKFQLPLPGSRCVVRYATPYPVSADVLQSARSLESARNRLQEALEQTGEGVYD